MDRLPSVKIRDSLEQRIVEGELGNGKRLDETELSRFYGVSRTPVREALQRLAESGLAEHLPRRGTFVCSPSLSQLVEMFEVMAELECMAIRLAARRATANDIDALEKDNETAARRLLPMTPRNITRSMPAFMAAFIKCLAIAFWPVKRAAFMIVFALSAACNYGYAAGWRNQWPNMISFWRHFVMAMPMAPWKP